MFGYFKFYKRFATYEMQRAYKNYYCGICFALEQHYGQKARLLLSYDVVVLGILGGVNHRKPIEKKLPCFAMKSKKIQFQNEKWKKIAAINILLFNAKIDDDINDDNSIKAKLAYLYFRNIIQKAKKDYPELSEIVTSGYKEMLYMERTGKNVLEICNVFSRLMVNLMKEAFAMSTIELNIITQISRWLYFIDQLDDYDDDVKEGKINALVIPGVDKRSFTNLYHRLLLDYLQDLMGELEVIKKGLDLSILENKIIYSILNDTIPLMSFQVIMDSKPAKSDYFKKLA